MRRRDVLRAVAGGIAWPVVAQAQQQATPVIGFLSSRSPGESAGLVTAFRQGLRESGFVEGQNLGIAFRWAEGHYEKLPALASELVNLPVAVIYAAGGPPSAFAAKGATSTIPVVFSAASDPVEIGLVPSLSQPGGNVTGMGIFNASLGTKRLELMKELMPNAGVIGYLLNPADRMSEIESKSVVSAGRSLGIDVRILNAKSDLNSIRRSRNLDGIIINWNTGAQRVFGYTAAEAVGQPISIVIPADRESEEREILTRIRRGERIDHFETIRQRKDGTLIVVSLSVSPVRNAEGQIVGASKIARDITEQKRSQEQIATLAREAEHRSKNLLATVQATVRLSQSETPDGLKRN